MLPEQAIPPLNPSWLPRATRLESAQAEATSAHWKPPSYLPEDDITCQVVNARDVKSVPGRPKTDLDAVWLCKLAERGMLRASFISSRRASCAT